MSFFLKNIFNVFAYGIASIRNEGMIFYESSFFSKLAILGAFCSTYSIFLFYYTAVHYGITKRAKLLIITSLSFVLYTLNVAGRDGIVIWLFSFVGLYCLFYPYLNYSFRKSIKKTIRILLLIFIPVFLSITLARFAATGNIKDGVESLFSYIGQPLNNLSYAIDFTNKTQMRSGDGTYPFEFMNYLFNNNNDASSRIDKIRELLKYGFNANQFASYIGAFYPAYSFYVFIIFLTICFLIYNQLKIKNNIVVTSNLLVVFPWYMILIIGVFYFYYSEISGNVYLLLPFIFRSLFKIKFKKNGLCLHSNI